MQLKVKIVTYDGSCVHWKQELGVVPQRDDDDNDGVGVGDNDDDDGHDDRNDDDHGDDDDRDDGDDDDQGDVDRDDHDDDDHDLVSNAASAVLHFQGKFSQADKESHCQFAMACCPE